MEGLTDDLAHAVLHLRVCLSGCERMYNCTDVCLLMTAKWNMFFMILLSVKLSYLSAMRSVYDPSICALETLLSNYFTPIKDAGSQQLSAM